DFCTGNCIALRIGNRAQDAAKYRLARRLRAARARTTPRQTKHPMSTRLLIPFLLLKSTEPTRQLSLPPLRAGKLRLSTFGMGKLGTDEDTQIRAKALPLYLADTLHQIKYLENIRAQSVTDGDKKNGEPREGLPVLFGVYWG